MASADEINLCSQQSTDIDCQELTSEESGKIQQNKKRKLAEIASNSKPGKRTKLAESQLKRKHEIDNEKMFVHLDPPKNLRLTIKNGVRCLESYWTGFQGFAKGRWIGRTITEVFQKEFIFYHKLYPLAALHKGRVFINGSQMMDPEYKMRELDRFVHLIHRHESDIPALPIQFITENENFLAVNKPPGLPCHPCGNYNLHSVLSMLKNEYGREDSDKLRLLYRLDRNTTGLLLFAKNYTCDNKFKEAVRNRSLKKEYLAKVEGIFPEGEIVCDQPIGLLSVQTGIRCVRPDGQEAKSRFRRLHVNLMENTSVVSVQIETGRTHQIRVHLQYLGYPIVNDNIYNDFAWGPKKGKGCDYGKSMDQLVADIMQRHSKETWMISMDEEYENRLKQIIEKPQPDKLDLQTLKFEEMPKYDPICYHCALYEKQPITKEYWDMHLHCWRYSGDDWSFEAPLPEWAKSPADTKTQGGNDPNAKLAIHPAERTKEVAGVKA